MAPTTRADNKPAKTMAKPSPKKPAGKVAKRSAKVTRTLSTGSIPAKHPSAAKLSAAKKVAKNVRKEKTAPKPTKQNGLMDSPHVNYCEEDRRLHGTYKRCGAGALFVAHKPSTDDNTTNRTNPAIPITKNPQPIKSDLNYDPVIRNSAKMLLRILNDLWERLTAEPMASEKSLQDVTTHMAETMNAMNIFLENEQEYENPNPQVNFRREFEEGDGVGNWITFKPSWFERGRFGVGDILSFESALRGLKAEGEVVTLHM